MLWKPHLRPGTSVRPLHPISPKPQAGLPGFPKRPETGMEGSEGGTGPHTQDSERAQKTEDSIHALETRDSEIDALLTREEVYTDVPRLMELNKEKEEIAGQLEKLYQSWEELAEKA